MLRHEGIMRILVVNPGSTSTKVAVFADERCLASAALPPAPLVAESASYLQASPGAPGTRAPSSRKPTTGAGQELWAEFHPRLAAIRAWLREDALDGAPFAAAVGRGGLLRPLEGGTYKVTDSMIADARANLQGIHASNLGCALARALADDLTGRGGGGPIPAFVVDPVSTDEFHPLARLSGLKEIPRKSLSHALSIHALVREVCREEGLDLRRSRFVVAHLGGGISVCPVVGGRILDANNANSGGPFSPSRAGGLPSQELLDLAYSGSYSQGDLRRMTLKEGGLMSYLGTGDAKAVENRVMDGDEEARLIYEAMGYQIAKEIGAMATVLAGRLDRILLTGGLARSDVLTAWVRARVQFLAPTEVWPEVEEMNALALGALRVLRGEEQAKEY